MLVLKKMEKKYNMYSVLCDRYKKIKQLSNKIK